MTITFKILLTLFILLGFFFLTIGLYSLDFFLLAIAILFAIASLLIVLEQKQLMRNPFRKL